MPVFYSMPQNQRNFALCTVYAVVMSRLLSVGAFHTNHFTTATFRQTRLLATSRQNIAIVGGGLAGLSTAYHLLEKLGDDANITIFDKAEPGQGGASSVAGG
jgi:NADPH-dependent 2,4-dienoyl-CoA reductase/sulfur reductase-like enzyme